MSDRKHRSTNWFLVGHKMPLYFSGNNYNVLHLFYKYRSKSGPFQVRSCKPKTWGKSDSKHVIETENSSRINARTTREHGGTFNLNRYDGPFLLNEHGDLYFLLHKNIVHIILLNLKKKRKKIVGRKRRYSRKRAQNRYSTCKL